MPAGKTFRPWMGGAKKMTSPLPERLVIFSRPSSVGKPDPSRSVACICPASSYNSPPIIRFVSPSPPSFLVSCSSLSSLPPRSPTRRVPPSPSRPHPRLYTTPLASPHFFLVYMYVTFRVPLIRLMVCSVQLIASHGTQLILYMSPLITYACPMTMGCSSRVTTLWATRETLNY